MAQGDGHSSNIVAELSARPTEQHEVTKVSKEQDVSDRDEVFYTACPSKSETGKVIVYEDEHEEEILQSDGETVKKVMINEASTILSTVPNSKAPREGFGSQETSECSDKPSFAFAFYTDRWRKEDRHGVTIACTPKES